MADKKVVAIAGASSGTGRAMAEILAEQGYPVALAARREDLLKEIAVSDPHRTDPCSNRCGRTAK